MGLGAADSKLTLLAQISKTLTMTYQKFNKR